MNVHISCPHILYYWLWWVLMHLTSIPSIVAFGLLEIQCYSFLFQTVWSKGLQQCTINSFFTQYFRFTVWKSRSLLVTVLLWIPLGCFHQEQCDVSLGLQLINGPHAIYMWYYMWWLLSFIFCIVFILIFLVYILLLIVLCNCTFSE